ncbi:MAG: MarR family transcriptional regulator [Flavobacteriales bacterium]|nr:MarR family transcriptional regulator [Flavobacteriales bacterium]MCB9447818.1 MarR family transcriptional regulator [Flavobacteriales bacterium]
MDVYKEAGYLVLGSRLKRLSERILQDIAGVYRAQDIPFEITWFPVFFELDRRGNLSITEMADMLQVSHPAIIQMVGKLRENQLVNEARDPADGRRRMVSLSTRGKKLLERIKPVWASLEKAMQGMMQEGEHLQHILTTLDELELQLNKKNVFTRVNEMLT